MLTLIGSVQVNERRMVLIDSGGGTVALRGVDPCESH